MEIQSIDLTKIIVAIITALPLLISPFIEIWLNRQKQPEVSETPKPPEELKPPKQPSRFIGKNTYFFTLILVILFNMAFILIPILSGTTLEITAPVNGTVVENCFFVNGEHRRVPEDKTPWLIVQPSLTDYIYPQNRIFLQVVDGEWSGRACVGESAGQYAVVAVLVSDDTDKLFHDYLLESEISGFVYKGIRPIPADVEEYSRVLVIKE